MQYFVRTRERRKEGDTKEYPPQWFFGLAQAVDEAKRRVMGSDPTAMLEADACFSNRNQVRTKYRCWLDERGNFHEHALV